MVQVGLQVELHTGHGAGQGQAAHGQHHDQAQQRQHHPLGNALQTLLQAHAAHGKTHDDGHGHPGADLKGVGQHIAEHAAHGLRVQPVKGAGEELEEVIQHPAGNRGVEHHQQVAARQAEPAVNVPFAARRLQLFVGAHRALAGGTAHGELHGHHGHAHHDQEEQIEQHKGAAAVVAHHIGEAPHIADADGASGADEDEPQPGFKGLAFQWYFLLCPLRCVPIRAMVP